MSSLDRAFIRAYAKDKSSAKPESTSADTNSEGEPVSFSTQRQPQTRYRIEPAHARWQPSMSAPPPPAEVETVLPTVLETEAAAVPNVWTPAPWPGEPAVELPSYRTPAKSPGGPLQPLPPPRPVAAPEAAPAAPTPVVAERSSAAAAYDTGEIVCLPGMSMATSDYLAAILESLAAQEVQLQSLEGNHASEPAIKPNDTPAHDHQEAANQQPVPQPTADELICNVTVSEREDFELDFAPTHSDDAPASHARDADLYRVAGAHAVAPRFPVPPMYDLEHLGAPIAPTNLGLLTEMPAAPSAAGSQADFSEELAQWEVERFFYPSLTDRLVREYAYFSQAGEKLKQAAAAGLKVLAITGLQREEGRSTLAICLARSAAGAGLKVGLVDCDFEQPTLAHQLRLDVSAGWQSAVANEVDLSEIAIRSGDDHITLLPLIDSAATTQLHIHHPAVAEVIASAAARLDVVILDLGPLNTFAVAANQSVPFDAAIVVWDRRHRQLSEAQAAAGVLSKAGVEAVGIAENFAREQGRGEALPRS